MFALVLALGCGEKVEKSMTSRPSKPTVDLVAKKREADLLAQADNPLLPLLPDSVGHLPALAGLRAGTPEAEVRALMARVGQANARIYEQPAKDRLVLGMALAEPEGVALNVHLDGQARTLIEYDLSMPYPSGQDAILAKWGEPPTTVRQSEGGAITQWLWADPAAGLSVELYGPTDAISVVKFREIDTLPQ